MMPFLNDPAAAQVPEIVTQVQHAGRDLTVYANGIPVAHATHETTSHLFSIGSFLRSGENTIRFEWVRREDPAIAFSAAVQENRLPEGLTDIVRVGPVDDDRVGQTMSREVTIRVELPRPWAWQDNPDVTLGPSERDEITAAVRALHAALASGRAEEAVALTEIMWTEMAGFRADAADAVAARYREMMADSAWSVAPLVPSKLTMTAYGPLVRVTSEGPLIESAEIDGSRLRIQGLFYARIDGHWLAVRPVS